MLLKDADGDDIVLINTSARTDLKVQAVGIDGETVGGGADPSLRQEREQIPSTFGETLNSHQI